MEEREEEERVEREYKRVRESVVQRCLLGNVRDRVRYLL